MEEFITEKVTLEVQVPVQDWIEYLCSYPDIFGLDYCGYWARGIEMDAELGWLIWEETDKVPFRMEPNRAEAIAAWEKNLPLPKGYYRLNKEAAVKAWVEGVLRWGRNWFTERGDAPTYDIVIQLALFGEIKYG